MGLRKVDAVTRLQRGRAQCELRLQRRYWDRMENEEGWEGGSGCREVLWTGVGVRMGLVLRVQAGMEGAISLYGISLFSPPQGRDAGDQHIVDVVLKMLQGEGASGAPPAGGLQPCPSHTGPSLPYRAAGGGSGQCQESSPGWSRCHGTPRTPWSPRATR